LLNKYITNKVKHKFQFYCDYGIPDPERQNLLKDTGLMEVLSKMLEKLEKLIGNNKAPNGIDEYDYGDFTTNRFTLLENIFLLILSFVKDNKDNKTLAFDHMRILSNFVDISTTCINVIKEILQDNKELLLNITYNKKIDDLSDFDIKEADGESDREAASHEDFLSSKMEESEIENSALDESEDFTMKEEKIPIARIHRPEEKRVMKPSLKPNSEIKSLFEAKESPIVKETIKFVEKRKQAVVGGLNPFKANNRLSVYGNMFKRGFHYPLIAKVVRKIKQKTTLINKLHLVNLLLSFITCEGKGINQNQLEVLNAFIFIRDKRKRLCRFKRNDDEELVCEIFKDGGSIEVNINKDNIDLEVNDYIVSFISLYSDLSISKNYKAKNYLLQIFTPEALGKLVTHDFLINSVRIVMCKLFVILYLEKYSLPFNTPFLCKIVNDKKLQEANIPKFSDNDNNDISYDSYFSSERQLVEVKKERVISDLKNQRNNTEKFALENEKEESILNISIDIGDFNIKMTRNIINFLIKNISAYSINIDDINHFIFIKDVIEIFTLLTEYRTLEKIQGDTQNKILDDMVYYLLTLILNKKQYMKGLMRSRSLKLENFDLDKEIDFSFSDTKKSHLDGNIMRNNLHFSVYERMKVNIVYLLRHEKHLGRNVKQHNQIKTIQNEITIKISKVLKKILDLVHDIYLNNFIRHFYIEAVNFIQIHPVANKSTKEAFLKLFFNDIEDLLPPLAETTDMYDSGKNKLTTQLTLLTGHERINIAKSFSNKFSLEEQSIDLEKALMLLMSGTKEKSVQSKIFKIFYECFTGRAIFLKYIKRTIVISGHTHRDIFENIYNIVMSLTNICEKTELWLNKDKIKDLNENMAILCKHFQDLRNYIDIKKNVIYDRNPEKVTDYVLRILNNMSIVRIIFNFFYEIEYFYNCNRQEFILNYEINKSISMVITEILVFLSELILDKAFNQKVIKGFSILTFLINFPSAIYIPIYDFIEKLVENYSMNKIKDIERIITTIKIGSRFELKRIPIILRILLNLLKNNTQIEYQDNLLIILYDIRTFMHKIQDELGGGTEKEIMIYTIKILCMIKKTRHIEHNRLETIIGLKYACQNLPNFNTLSYYSNLKDFRETENDVILLSTEFYGHIIEYLCEFHASDIRLHDDAVRNQFIIFSDSILNYKIYDIKGKLEFSSVYLKKLSYFALFSLFFTSIFKYMTKMYDNIFPRSRSYSLHNELKVKLISETLNNKSSLDLMCCKKELMDVIDLTEMCNFFNNDSEVFQVVKFERKVIEDDGVKTIYDRTENLTTVMLWEDFIKLITDIEDNFFDLEKKDILHIDDEIHCKDSGLSILTSNKVIVNNILVEEYEHLIKKILKTFDFRAHFLMIREDKFFDNFLNTLVNYLHFMFFSNSTIKQKDFKFLTGIIIGLLNVRTNEILNSENPKLASEVFIIEIRNKMIKNGIHSVIIEIILSNRIDINDYLNYLFRVLNTFLIDSNYVVQKSFYDFFIRQSSNISIFFKVITTIFRNDMISMQGAENIIVNYERDELIIEILTFFKKLCEYSNIEWCEYLRYQSNSSNSQNLIHFFCIYLTSLIRFISNDKIAKINACLLFLIEAVHGDHQNKAFLLETETLDNIIDLLRVSSSFAEKDIRYIKLRDENRANLLIDLSKKSNDIFKTFKEKCKTVENILKLILSAIENTESKALKSKIRLEILNAVIKRYTFELIQLNEYRPVEELLQEWFDDVIG
jgi:hypothetical protein